MPDADELGKEDALVGAVLRQLDGLIAEWGNLMRTIRERRLKRAAASAFTSAGMSAINRMARRDSEFAAQGRWVVETYRYDQPSRALEELGGILKGLRKTVASGYLVSVEERIHAETLSDLLEMAEYLLGGGYRDAAAVLIRGVLEGHLRELCARNGIDKTYKDSKGKIRPKSVSTMNADLKKGAVYSTTDQKNVTSWYGLGTDAAHGHYESYTPEQLKLMLLSVTDFIARHTA